MLYSVFGGYIKYPGTIHAMGSIAIGGWGFSPLSLRGRELPGSFTLLTKRYFSPIESFVCRVIWRPYLCFVLHLSLVPEKVLWCWVAAVLTSVALLLGRAHLDLWGDHIYTGGECDFYAHGTIPYSLGEWQSIGFGIGKATRQ